ncbi:MAG: signal peptidase II [Acidimicrobium sp.]|nr:MAG: signal peptidase II [Acidimicrobium sp.]
MQVALVLTRAIGSTPKIIIVAVLVVDQATKNWALNSLGDGRTIDLFWTLRFNLVFNSGMAFSQGQGAGRLIGLLAVGVALWLWFSLRKASTKMSLLATSMLIGGALGNVGDRLFRGEKWLAGAVVDFIDFQWFPVFNIADSAVTIGAAMLIMSAVKASRSKAQL